MVAPITGDVEERLKEKLSDAAIRSASHEGVLYGAPVSTEAAAIFYNKDIVDTPVTSFEELFEFAKEYNDLSQNKFAFMMNDKSPLLTRHTDSYHHMVSNDLDHKVQMLIIQDLTQKHS